MKKQINQFCIVLAATIFVVVLISFSGCTNNQNPIQPDSVNLNYTPKTLVKQNVIGVENNLRKVAKILAVVLKEKKVLKMLKKELGKKFDGEPEVLYNHINKKTLSDNSTLENEMLLKSNKNGNINIKKIIAELSSVMNINLFMPWYDKWDGVKIPLVTYYPYSKNEFDIKEVQAFDSDGNEVMISKENAEMYNYIVVGANERTDRNGNYSYSYQKSLPSDGEGGGGGAGGGGSGLPADIYNVILHKWIINKNYDDGWLLGSMELYIKLKVKDTITGQIILQNDHWMIDDSYLVNDTKTYDIKLYSRANNNDFSVYFEIWEDDGWFSGADDLVANGVWEYLTDFDVDISIGTDVSYINWPPSIYPFVVLFERFTPTDELPFYHLVWLNYRIDTN